jgi:hypothetical protein
MEVTLRARPVLRADVQIAINMNLSFNCVLIYVLRHSGCVGRLLEGRVERHSASGLSVYDARGTLNEYISGSRMRSWCVCGERGTPIHGWCDIQPDDAAAIEKIKR